MAACFLAFAAARRSSRVMLAAAEVLGPSLSSPSSSEDSSSEPEPEPEPDSSCSSSEEGISSWVSYLFKQPLVLLVAYCVIVQEGLTHPP